MIKEKTKIILIIVLIIQIISPFTFLIYQSSVNKHLESNTEYIKLNIDEITFSFENRLYIKFCDSYIYDYNYNKYIVFEPSINNEYSNIYSTENPTKTNHYLTYDNLDELIYYEIEDPYGIYEKYGSLNIYNKYNELNNVINGYSDGPLTEAYAIIGIYNNQFKINKIYINGYTLEDYIKLYGAKEIDLLRYHRLFWDVHYTEDEYLNLIDENKRKYYNITLTQY